MQLPHPYSEPWLESSGYLNRLARRNGVLMSCHIGDEEVVLRGDGDGSVMIDGLATCAGRYDVLAALTVLADAGAFDGDSNPDRWFGSGSWDAGDVAAVVAPWFDLGGQRTEFLVDDIEMCTDGRGRADPLSPPEAETLILAADGWDLEGGSGSPGNDDWGEVVLLRLGPRYVVYQCSGGDVVADEIDANSDEDAKAVFRGGSAPTG